MRPWQANGRTVAGDGRPRIMGVVNVTPDSFSDGGRWPEPASAADHAARLVAEGADLLDLGGESSRPGSRPVSLDEELRRVLPALEAIAEAVTVPISVDTTKPQVARRALDAGAAIINDIGGLRDPALALVVAESTAGVVLMHMAGTPQTMQADPKYENVVNDVYDSLARQADAAGRFGIARERIALDPGIGFGKTFDHNLALLRNLPRFANLGCALLLGTSRKGFLGMITGRPVDQRVTASVVSSLAALAQGADVVRVHDVGPMADAVKVWSAVHGWEARP